MEYYDVIPTVGGMLYGGGMTPGYWVHILEGKHKGETLRIPSNYLQSEGAAPTEGAAPKTHSKLAKWLLYAAKVRE